MSETQPKKRCRGRPKNQDSTKPKPKLSNGKSNITLLASSSYLNSQRTNPQTSSMALQWDLDNLENLHPNTARAILAI